MTREPLPARRPAESFDFEHRQIEYTATIGFYGDDRRLGEAFLRTKKYGTQTDDDARDLSIMFSLYVQYGAPVDKLREALTRDANGVPATVIGYFLDLLDTEDSARQVA